MLEFDAALSTAIEVDPKKLSGNGASSIGSTPAARPKGPLSPDLLDKMQRYWCAANYLCVGQIYLQDNPLLREPLTKADIKPRLLGHWGTSAGQNFIYVHLNRLDPRRGRKHNLHLRPRPRRPDAERVRVSRRNVQRRASGNHARRSRHASALPLFFDARRNSQPLRTAHAEFDARRRRTRLFADARFWSRVR